MDMGKIISKIHFQREKISKILPRRVVANDPREASKTLAEIGVARLLIIPTMPIKGDQCG
jgi:hypothetical protein